MAGTPPFLTVKLRSLGAAAEPPTPKAQTTCVEKPPEHMAGLPVTDRELIAQCQREYEEAASRGGQEAMDACFRLAWALVHSSERPDIQRGVDLLEALLQGSSYDQRDLLYLLAVGRYRQRKYLEARRTLKSLLEVHPEFRQADGLLETCESEIVKDGLVGVGAGAAILGVIGAVAIAVLRKH